MDNVTNSSKLQIEDCPLHSVFDFLEINGWKLVNGISGTTGEQYVWNHEELDIGNQECRGVELVEGFNV